MKDESDFTKIIASKIQELDNAVASVRSNVVDPAYHSSRVRDAVKDALEQLANIDESMHRAELIGVLNQMPAFVASAWAEARNAERSLGTQLSVWQDVQREYDLMVQEDESDLQAEEEPEIVAETSPPIDDAFLEAVRVGEIEEPTRLSGIRRKPGVRPESLRKVRNAKAIIENSPEQK